MNLNLNIFGEHKKRKKHADKARRLRRTKHMAGGWTYIGRMSRFKKVGGKFIRQVKDGSRWITIRY